jgi:hypothetical protein
MIETVIGLLLLNGPRYVLRHHEPVRAVLRRKTILAIKKED